MIAENCEKHKMPLRLLCRLSVVVIAILLTASCQSLRAEDVNATLQAENVSYATEAASLYSTMQLRRTAVVETAQAAQQYVQERNSMNIVLIATVRAGDPPEIAIGAPVVMQGPAGTPSANTPQFVQTGLASMVNESDGCALGLTTEFSASTPRIYATTRALNIQAGTRMRVEWLYTGSMVFQESWTVPGSHDDFCLWFYIEPQIVAFTPGDWQMILYREETPASAPVDFRIVP